MYVATAASAYGSEYYEALLAEAEDDILKPKRSLARNPTKYRDCTKALEKDCIVINSDGSKLMAWVQILSGNFSKVPGFRG